MYVIYLKEFENKKEKKNKSLTFELCNPTFSKHHYIYTRHDVTKLQKLSW